jgi:hypothetical protein
MVTSSPTPAATDPEVRREILDAQPVVVRSDRGELTGIARVDSSVRRGAVSLPH